MSSSFSSIGADCRSEIRNAFCQGPSTEGVAGQKQSSNLLFSYVSLIWFRYFDTMWQLGIERNDQGVAGTFSLHLLYQHFLSPSLMQWPTFSSQIALWSDRKNAIKLLQVAMVCFLGAVRFPSDARHEQMDC